MVEVKGGLKFMKFFRSLPKNDKFYKEIDNILELIKENPYLGNRIQYEKIPKCYISAYDIPNLFRVQLSRGWRLVYSLTGKRDQKTVYILEIFDHKDYEKRFGY
ncbi:MAG: type II toxin-antitoxin system RelE/ParE family toxin [Nitrososphaerota archaeon]